MASTSDGNGKALYVHLAQGPSSQLLSRKSIITILSLLLLMLLLLLLLLATTIIIILNKKGRRNVERANKGDTDC